MNGEEYEQEVWCWSTEEQPNEPVQPEVIVVQADVDE